MMPNTTLCYIMLLHDVLLLSNFYIGTNYMHQLLEVLY